MTNTVDSPNKRRLNTNTDHKQDNRHPDGRLHVIDTSYTRKHKVLFIKHQQRNVYVDVIILGESSSSTQKSEYVFSIHVVRVVFEEQTYL